jgi:hypothetical protein
MRTRFFAVLLLLVLSLGGTALGTAAPKAKPGVEIAPMGRLRTIGFETGSISEGGASFQTVAQTTVARSGAWAVKVDSGASGVLALNLNLDTAERVLGRTYYLRGYFRFDHLPDSVATLIRWDAGALARLTSGGKLQLWNEVAGSQVGSDSAETIVADAATWHRIEISITIGTGAVDAMALQLNGVSVASASGLSLGDTVTSAATVGWPAETPGANKVLYLDDVAINDSAGATQNSWPGAGKIVLLAPTADSAVGTGWVDGDGTGTLFGSVDNTPPVGVATPANGTQIKNLTSTTTGNYDATMTTYAAAGIAAGDTVTLVQSWTSHGIIGQTNARNGAVQIVSNPAQGSEDTVAMPTSVAGTWPTNWKQFWGTAQVGDIASGNRGTAPVLRVGKRTATTRENECAAMFLCVEYVPAVGVSSSERSWTRLARGVLQGVGRGAR